MGQLPAIGYCRVSTDDQSQEGCSIEHQAERFKGWCVAHGYHPHNLYIDEGLSGSSISPRNGVREAVREACEIHCPLVVLSLSRLSRSLLDTIAIIDQLQTSGGDLVSLTEPYDTTTATGKLLFRFTALLAEFERDQVSQRTREIMAFKRAAGEVLGQVPFGYNIDSDGKTLITDPEQVDIVRRILELHDSGKSWRAIARHLNDLRIKSKKGSRWYGNVVKRIAEYWLTSGASEIINVSR